MFIMFNIKIFTFVKKDSLIKQYKSHYLKNEKIYIIISSHYITIVICKKMSLNVKFNIYIEILIFFYYKHLIFEKISADV